MKKTHLTSLAMVSLTVAAVFTLVVTSGHTATGTIGSTVSIAQPLEITGTGDLVFGVFIAPTSGTDTWTLSESDGSLTKTGGTGDSQDLFPADHSMGSFSVTGEPNATVNYSAAVTSDFADANLSLTGVGLNPLSPQNLDGSGNLAMDVGGVLDITAGAASGAHAATIELTVNY